MQVLTKIKKVVDNIVAWINIMFLAIMTILVTYQVVTRYFFNRPSAIAESLSQYMFVWTIMFGSAYTFGLKEHLEISVLKDKLKPLPRLIDDFLINTMLGLFSAGVMGFGGFALTKQQMGSIDAALQIPKGIIYMSIPVCAIVILFYAIYLYGVDYQRYKESIAKKGETE